MADTAADTQSTMLGTAYFEDWIRPGSRVLDIGCGRGEVLRYLHTYRGVRGLGVDFDAASIQSCIDKGVPVIEHNIEHGLARAGIFLPGSFDCVLIKNMLHLTSHPVEILKDACAVTQQIILVIRNFGEISVRLRYLVRGHYSWDWDANEQNRHAGGELATARGKILPFDVTQLLALMNNPQVASRMHLKEIRYAGGHWHRICGRLLPNLTARWAYCLLEVHPQSQA